MDCLKAQEIISAALDRDLVDAQELEAAKRHCRSCTECGNFVKALLALQRTPAPKASPQFAASVMEQIRESQAPASIPTAISTPPSADMTAEEPLVPTAHSAAPPAPTPTTPTRIPSPSRKVHAAPSLMDGIRDPRNRRAVVTWATVAAVLLVVTGIGAMAGMRAILVPKDIPATESTTMAGAGAANSSSSYDTFSSTSQPLQGDAASKAAALGEAARSQAATSSPNLIVVGGSVFKLTGPAPDVLRDGLSKKGTTNSSLSTAGTPSEHDVLGSVDPARVYIVSGNELLAFERVTRDFEGKTYVLQSGALATFSQSPTWATNTPKPVLPSGSPSMDRAGTDSAGTTVFKPTGASTSAGIAVGPGTPASDPLPGTTDWTWWTPLP